MCKCTCEKQIDENGRIKSICMRKGCNQPIYIREYSNYSKENPLFCAPCLVWIYSVIDEKLHIDGIKEYFIDETTQTNPEWRKLRESYKQKVIDSLIK